MCLRWLAGDDGILIPEHDFHSRHDQEMLHGWCSAVSWSPADIWPCLRPRLFTLQTRSWQLPCLTQSEALIRFCQHFCTFPYKAEEYSAQKGRPLWSSDAKLASNGFKGFHVPWNIRDSHNLVNSWMFPTHRSVRRLSTCLAEANVLYVAKKTLM